MGFFSNFAYSWNRSGKLRELQLKIAPPGPRDVASDFRASLSGTNGRDKALDEFLDLCMADRNVSRVMAERGLSRKNLKEFYAALSLAGLGQWVMGHYAALSTLAYPEPLAYLADSRQRFQALRVPGRDQWSRIASDLLDYWEGKIPQGRLMDRLK